MTPNQNRRRSRSQVATAIGVLLWAACACWGQPEGRELLRNGGFAEGDDRPTHWFTRVSASTGAFRVIPPKRKEEPSTLIAEVLRPSSRPWTMELRQSIDGPMKKGEKVYITFDYRITPGYAFHCYWQIEAAPWSKLLSIRLAADPEAKKSEWQKCMMVTENFLDLPARNTSLTFHLAEQKGTLQMRNVSMIAFDLDTPLESLPTNCYPVFGGDYHDNDWRNTVLGRIEELRTGQLKVIVSRGGEPVPDAKVTLTQQSRHFLFGTEVAVPYFSDDVLERAQFVDFRKRLEGVEEKLPKYRKKLADPRLFNMVSLRDALVWRTNAAWGDAFAEAAVDAFLEQGLEVRGHALYSPALRFAPPQCRTMDKGDLATSLGKFITRQARKYNQKVGQWDVVHAPLTFAEMYDKIGEDSLVDAFKRAEAEAPETVFLLSDDKSLVAYSTEHVDELLDLVRWLQSQGARIDALALNATMTRPYIAPHAIERRLDQIAEITKLPLIITALAVDAPRESIQAERLRDLLLLFFSHHAVTGVCLKGLWEAEMPAGNAALFRKNFAIKPAGKTYESLLTEEWWTHAQQNTNPDGTVQATCFLGRYNVVVKKGEQRVQRQIVLEGGDMELAIDLAEKPAVEATTEPAEREAPVEQE